MIRDYNALLSLSICLVLCPLQSLAGELEDYFREVIYSEVYKDIKEPEVLREVVQIRFNREFEKWKSEYFLKSNAKIIQSPIRVDQIREGDLIQINLDHWYSK